MLILPATANNRLPDQTIILADPVHPSANAWEMAVRDEVSSSATAWISSQLTRSVGLRPTYAAHGPTRIENIRIARSRQYGSGGHNRPENEANKSMAAIGTYPVGWSYGTHLQAKGMPIGVAPEIWILENHKILQDLQTAYYEAGSRLANTAATFGANRPKLTRHLGQDIDVGAINRRLAEITISLRDGHRTAKPNRPFFVAGDIGPTGRFLYPVRRSFP